MTCSSQLWRVRTRSSGLVRSGVRELILSSPTGTRNILKAAAAEKSVRRMVLTSSFASIVSVADLPDVGKTYGDDDWNPATYEEAAKSTNPAFVYCASKALAEAEAWRFVKEEKVNFSLTTLCPPMILFVLFLSHFVDPTLMKARKAQGSCSSSDYLDGPPQRLLWNGLVCRRRHRDSSHRLSRLCRSFLPPFRLVHSLTHSLSHRTFVISPSYTFDASRKRAPLASDTSPSQVRRFRLLLSLRSLR